MAFTEELAERVRNFVNSLGLTCADAADVLETMAAEYRHLAEDDE